MKANVLTVFLLCSFAACLPQEPEDEIPPTKMLPAWKLPGDYRVPGKADQYSDYRAKHPEWYAVTVPPSKTNFRAVLEWEQMRTVLITYTGGLGTKVTKTMTDMVKYGIDAVGWDVVVPNNTLQNEFITLLKNAGIPQTKIDQRVRFHVFACDTIWTIDFGPFPLVGSDGTMAFVDTRYYHERVYDDAIPAKLAKEWGVSDYRAPMDYEGGNFQTDGVGTCYLSQGAYWENPDKTEAELNEVLGQYLGCKKVIVLEPLEDGTTHIDMFSKLAGKNTFVLGKCTTADCTSTTVQTLEDDANILAAATLADGTKLKVLRIPMPYQKDDVWRTYTNSVMANGVNLFPAYSSYAQHQDEALSVWQAALPDWTHVPIESGEIITWGGAQHCISRAIPAASFAKWVPDGTCSGGKCQAPEGGYNGGCSSSADCTGPAWVCAYNDCGGVTVPCGDITDVGCCDGTTLKYCDNGNLVVQKCGNSGCGWNKNQNYYDCGFTGSDPSGTPRACKPCVPSCLGKECGSDGCGGSCGQCNPGEKCDANSKCVGCEPDCTGKQCGSDGCNGVCGSCPEGQECNESGQCVTPVDPCHGITIEGCCKGNQNLWCQDGQLQSEDCGDNGCGWAAPQGRVAGYYCGGKGTDPSGQFPLACPDCTPSCSGKECGSDGCGGSCGTCPGGKYCDSSGHCAEDPCHGITMEGCCETVGSQVVNKWCDKDHVLHEDQCGVGDMPKGCGWATVQGFSGYYCGGNGSDPTGTHPMACNGGAADPVPDTADDAGQPETADHSQPEVSSPDVAEASSPDWPQEAVASDVATPEADLATHDAQCTPDCSGRQCGPDGCGGTCGTCPGGFTCNSAGMCEAETPAQDAISAEIPSGKGGSSSGGCTAGGPSGPALSLLLLSLAFIRRKSWFL